MNDSLTRVKPISAARSPASMMGALTFCRRQETVSVPASEHMGERSANTYAADDLEDGAEEDGGAGDEEVPVGAMDVVVDAACHLIYADGEEVAHAGHLLIEDGLVAAHLARPIKYWLPR